MLTKKNIISLLLLVVMIAGIPLATYLVRQQQLLRSQAAATDAIKFTGPNVKLLAGNKVGAIDKSVQVEVISPYEAVGAKNPVAALASTNRFSPANPGDGDSVTVSFTKNTDTNFVKLVVDGSMGDAIPSGNLTSCPATGCTVVWPASHSKHTAGLHTLAVHPFYCDPSDTAKANCIAGTPDADQIQVGTGGPVAPAGPAGPRSGSGGGGSFGIGPISWEPANPPAGRSSRVLYRAQGTGETEFIVIYLFQGGRQLATLESVSPANVGHGAWANEGPFPAVAAGQYTIKFVATKRVPGCDINRGTAVCERTGEQVDLPITVGGGGAPVAPAPGSGAPTATPVPARQPTATPVPASTGPDVRSTNHKCEKQGSRVHCWASRLGDTDRVDVYVNSFSGNAFTVIRDDVKGNGEPWGNRGNGTFNMIFVAIDDNSGRHAVTGSYTLCYNCGSFIPEWLIKPFTPRPVFAQVTAQCNVKCATPGSTEGCAAGYICVDDAGDKQCLAIACPGNSSCDCMQGVAAATATPVALTPLRTKTDVPAGTKTTGFKISETNSDAAWSVAPLNPYAPGSTNLADYEFAANPCVTTPCDPYPRGNRRVYVQFIGQKTDGTEYKEVWSSDIILALKPVVESATCTVPGTGTGTTITVKGSHFGDEAGAVTFAGQNTSVPVGSWTNLQVTASSTQSITGAQNVVLTTVDGQASEPVLCGTGESLLDIKATLACRSADKALSVADIEIREDTPQGKVVEGSKQEKVAFNADGRPEYTPPALVEGKAYKFIIKAPNSLTKVVKFTAAAGTTAIETLNLPVGDIVPDNGDCQINQLDRSRLVSEWTAAKSTGKKSDLNGDTFTNSFDYSCMMSNFRKECDRP